MVFRLGRESERDVGRYKFQTDGADNPLAYAVYSRSTGKQQYEEYKDTFIANVFIMERLSK